MFKKIIRIQVYFWLLLLFPSFSFSDWILINEKSKLNFISTKASDIKEVHTFKILSGSVTKSGNGIVEVNLGSVETLIPIRNERMKNLLFQTEIYPSADFRLNVNLDKILLIEKGNSLINRYKGELELKNKQFPLEVKIKTTRLDHLSFSITTYEPLILNAENLGLSAGIESLRAVAGLPSISKSVPVTFSLIFKKQEKYK